MSRQVSNGEDTSNKLPITVIYILGPPGAGKGTACKRFAMDYPEYNHLSVGDYLRELVKDNAITGPSAAYGGIPAADLEATMRQNRTMEAEPIVEILRYKLEQEYITGRVMFLIDGFPRAEAAAKLFDNRVAAPSKILHFACSKETAGSRYIGRGREKSLDNKDRFATRFDKHEQDNPPVIARYDSLVKKIDAETSEENVYQQMLDCFR